MGNYTSRYALKDPTQSHVDPVRETKAKPRDAALASFATELDRLSDRVLISDPVDRVDIECMEKLLGDWARARAMLSNLDQNDRIGKHQGIMMQAWVGAAIANSVLKIGGLQAFSNTNRENISAWLRILGQSVVDEYQDPADWKRPDNNHRIWAGFAVASIGVLLQEESLLRFGNRVLLQTLAEVDGTGILPKEMGRGQKSLGYQNFALIAVAGLRSVLDRNGWKLTSPQAEILLNLIRSTMDAIREPQRIEKIVHQPKEFKLNASTDLAWGDVMLPWLRGRDMKLATEINAFMIETRARPTWHIWLGGNTSVMYNPSSVR